MIGVIHIYVDTMFIQYLILWKNSCVFVYFYVFVKRNIFSTSYLRYFSSVQQTCKHTNKILLIFFPVTNGPRKNASVRKVYHLCCVWNVKTDARHHFAPNYTKLSSFSVLKRETRSATNSLKWFSKSHKQIFHPAISHFHLLLSPSFLLPPLLYISFTCNVKKKLRDVLFLFTLTFDRKNADNYFEIALGR